MTSLLFWIACLLVQKSACLASESIESTSISSQTVELSDLSSESELRSSVESKHNISNTQGSEFPHLTTSVNDIECSNTEGCASPINVFNTPTIIPVVHSKITWQPRTNKRISTEATPTNSDVIPTQYNPSTANDDGGNELDSEVKDAEANLLTIISTIMPSDKFENPTSSVLSEADSLISKSNDSSTFPTVSENVSAGNLVQVHTESKSTVEADDKLTLLISTSESQTEIIPHTPSAVSEHATKETILEMTQDYTAHSEADSLMSKSNDSSTFPTVVENLSVRNLVQVHTESTSTVEADDKLTLLINTSESQTEIIPHTPSAVSEHATKETVLDMSQDYMTHSVPSKLHSISSITTPVPILFSSSIDRGQSTLNPSSQRNADTFQGDLVSATTQKPDVFTTEYANFEDEGNLSDNMKNISQSSKSSIMAEKSESNVTVNESILPTSEHPINLMPYNVSAYPRLLESKDESKFETTVMPHADMEKSELHTNPSTITLEDLMSSDSHLHMHIVNVSDKEVSEGHGLKRNLSHFIISTGHSFMTTELLNGVSTESYSTKDIVTSKLSEATSFTNVNVTQFSTITPEKVTPADMLDDTTTKESVYSNPTLKLFRSLSNFSEVIESSTSVAQTERSTEVSDERFSFTLSHTINETSMDDEEVEVTSLNSLVPKYMETDKMTSEGSDLVTEVHITEKSTAELPISTSESSSIEKFISTTETPYTEKEISISSTFESKLEPNPSSEFIEILGRSNSRVSTILNDVQFTTKQLTEPSSSSVAYYSTTPHNIHNRANDGADATTITFLSSEDVPTVPVTILPKQFLDETKSTRTFVEPISTLSIGELNSTQSATVHDTERKEDSVSTTHPSLEQTASVPPTPLTYQQTTPAQKSYLITTLAPTRVPSIDFNSISTLEDTSNKTDQLPPTTNSAASDYSKDESPSTTVISESDANITTTSESLSNIMTTTYHFSSFSTDSPVDLSTHSSILTTSTTKKEPETSEADATVLSTTLSNIPFYSTLSTTETVLAQTETRRGGKHIPFSTVSTRKETSGNGIIRITTTGLPAEDESQMRIYNQMQLDELSLAEKANIITATILLSSKHLNEDEMHEKMMKVHNWLLHVLMKEFQNWTRDPFEESEESLNTAPFGNISIFYISPTPEMNSSGITLTFIVYNLWKNETLQVDFVLGILNYYSKELKESINASAAYFYHGHAAGDHYLMSAILERYGVVIVTICLAVVLILLLVCVVIFYRKKTRRLVHCVSNSKFKQNIHEAVGIDLNPAIVILQDEKNDKVGNGNKICDDEGWLAPINDVPQAEDTNVPFIQDTKL